MQYNFRVSYVTCWEVEAPDEETAAAMARKVVREALQAANLQCDESDECHRLALTVVGDPCPDCGGHDRLRSSATIESKPMSADEVAEYMCELAESEPQEHHYAH